MLPLIQQDIYGVFASAAWQATGIKAYPRNYQGAVVGLPYVLISILVPYRVQNTYNKVNKTSGMVILSVFTNTTRGDVTLFETCEILATFLEDKLLPNKTKTELGSLVNTGVDTDNRSLYRGDLRIPFTLYGE